MIVQVYFDRRKVNSMDPSSQLRPPSFDESSEDLDATLKPYLTNK
jgi:hypothetical protein